MSKGEEKETVEERRKERKEAYAVREEKKQNKNNKKKKTIKPLLNAITSLFCVCIAACYACPSLFSSTIRLVPAG